MENREIEPVNLVASSSGETQPPLVVDLPDGQKLVVGSLDPGVVVEVATWRGTGRPDSRTNRLMLGVSSNEGSEQLKNQIESPGKTQTTLTLASNNNSSEWSNSRINTGIDNSFINSSGKSTSPVVKRSVIKGFLKKPLIKIIGTFLIFSIVVSLLVGPLHIRMAHPNGGANTVLGSASSSLIFIRPSKNLKIGQNVLVKTSTSLKNPLIALVSAVDGDQLLLATNRGYIEVKKTQILGKVIMVLPFVGYAANLFN
jgi:hypothetical protein